MSGPSGCLGEEDISLSEFGSPKRMEYHNSFSRKFRSDAASVVVMLVPIDR